MGREASQEKSPNFASFIAAADKAGINLDEVSQDRLLAAAVEGRPLDGLHLVVDEPIEGDQHMEIAGIGFE